MKNLFQVILLILAVFLFNTSVIAAQNEPVALLIQGKGNLSFSKDGIKWKKIRRNKFLFASYLVKTGDDGSCMLILQKNNSAVKMAANQKVQMSTDNIIIISGHPTPTEVKSSLFMNFQRKFTKVQKHTVIRRATSKVEKKVRLDSATDITLSDAYPDLVWQNLGPEYSYRLNIAGKEFIVPGSTQEFIRFVVPPLKPGRHEYRIQVLENDTIVYSQQEMKFLDWLTTEEQAKILLEVKSINSLAPGLEFLVANFLDEKGLKVAALDQYHKFFLNNPNENELRPFLLKIYDDLKLATLKKRETELFNLQFED